MKKILVVLISIIIVPFSITNFFNDYKEGKIESKLVIKDAEPKKEKYKDTQIRVLRKSGNIETMNLEEYLVGVVSGEVPASFEEDAIKAQAIAARTYALKKIENNKDSEYDVTDDVRTQVYISNDELKNIWNDNYDRYIDKMTKCVQSTKGEYLTYDGEIIYAFFFSYSNGKTEDNVNVFGSDIPYLKVVDSSFDENEVDNFTYQVKYDLNTFFNKLVLPYSEEVNITDKELTASGRVKNMTINGTSFTGIDLRKKLSLRSTDFEINKEGKTVTILTKGYGHGVGMSQYGANALAKQNKKYDEILKYYYQGTNLQKL